MAGPQDFLAGLVTSLQGQPEEIDSGPVNCRTIGEGLRDRLLSLGFRVVLIDRDQFSGGGDQYSAAARMADAAGVSFQFHIH